MAEKVSRLHDIPGNEGDIAHLRDTMFPISPKLLAGKTVLQCGARPKGGWQKLFEVFEFHGYDTFHILEIHEPNVKALKQAGATIFCGDIRKINEYKPLLPQYDVVVFWHGLEHISKKEIPACIDEVMKKCKIAFIAGNPWGKWPQGKIFQNEHEIHRSTIYVEDFQKWGFDEIVTLNVHPGGADKRNSMYGIKYKD